MKRVLLIVLVIVAAGSASFGMLTVTGPGSWQAIAQVEECDPGRLCAEWYEPDGSMNGTVCCILETNMFSTSFNACEVVIRGPRPDGNML